jgi:hypothetical protein
MTSAASSATSAALDEPANRRVLRATEVDASMLGMIGAPALLRIEFHLYAVISTGESLFVTPRSLWNFSACKRLQSVANGEHGDSSARPRKFVRQARVIRAGKRQSAGLGTNRTGSCRLRLS